MRLIGIYWDIPGNMLILYDIIIICCRYFTNYPQCGCVRPWGLFSLMAIWIRTRMMKWSLDPWPGHVGILAEHIEDVLMNEILTGTLEPSKSSWYPTACGLTNVFSTKWRILKMGDPRKSPKRFQSWGLVEFGYRSTPYDLGNLQMFPLKMVSTLARQLTPSCISSLCRTCPDTAVSRRRGSVGSGAGAGAAAGAGAGAGEAWRTWRRGDSGEVIGWIETGG